MLKIKVISPSGTVFEGEASHVIFPGEVGQFEVLPKHAPIISTLVKGDIACYASDGKEQKIPIQSGFVEVRADEITACVEE